MPEKDYDRDFPRLKTLGFLRTSEPADYNCIAFAVGDTTRWWWPSGHEDEYWPLPIPDKITLQTFIDAFLSAGYARCDDGGPETDLEKIALYGLNEETIRHAARLEAGKDKWQSKLGPAEDIEHTLVGLEGPCYGKVLAYFSKRVAAPSADLPPTVVSPEPK
jgi:hypothetical protein